MHLLLSLLQQKHTIPPMHFPAKNAQPESSHKKTLKQPKQRNTFFQNVNVMK